MRYTWMLLALLLGASRIAAATPGTIVYLSYIQTPNSHLYVNTGRQIIRFYGTTGVYMDTFVPPAAAGDWPEDFAFGPDGTLYTIDGFTIGRYNGRTGAFIDTVINLRQYGFLIAHTLVFGPDGKLYVGGQFAAEGEFWSKVTRFDALTGQFVDDFITALAGNQTIIRRMLFGPDGNLYLNCADSGNVKTFVLRYDRLQRTLIDWFIPAQPEQWLSPGFAFGPDRNLYILRNKEIVRFNGKTGAFMDVFVSAEADRLYSVIDLTFGPDTHLYAIRQDNDQILRYNGESGAFINSFGPSQPDFAVGQNRLVFFPDATNAHATP